MRRRRRSCGFSGDDDDDEEDVSGAGGGGCATATCLPSFGGLGTVCAAGEESFDASLPSLPAGDTGAGWCFNGVASDDGCGGSLPSNTATTPSNAHSTCCMDFYNGKLEVSKFPSPPRRSKLTHSTAKRGANATITFAVSANPSCARSNSRHRVRHSDKSSINAKLCVICAERSCLESAAASVGGVRAPRVDICTAGGGPMISVEDRPHRPPTMLSPPVTITPPTGMLGSPPPRPRCFEVSAPGKVILFGEHAVVFEKVSQNKRPPSTCITTQLNHHHTL